MEKVAGFTRSRYPEFIANPQRRRKQSYQTLFEVLGQLLAPEKTREIIEASLGDLGWVELPTGRSKFEMLVSRAVGPRVIDLLGEADGQLVIEELLRIAQLMPDDAPRSGERARPQRDTDEAPKTGGGAITMPAPADMVIALATASPSRLERLEGRVAGSARVRSVHDALSLFDVLQTEPVALLLIDLVDPALRWPTLLALAQDVPYTTTVYVWCADTSLRESVEERGWAFVTNESDLDSVVDELCT